jgi:hypothetical protein
MILRGKTFLHILPTLVNFQWDDQLDRASDFVSFWRAECNCLSSRLTPL